MSVDDVRDRAEKRQEQHEADFHARIAALEAALDATNAKYDYVELWFANLFPTDWDKCMDRWAERSTP